MAKSNSGSLAIKEVAERMVKKPFKKHHATIFMRGNLSTLERKFWNLATKNAYFELGKVRKHTVDLDVLCEAAGYDSKDLNPVKEAFEKLTATSISWIRQLDDGSVEEDQEWVATSFLAGAKIRGKTLTYEYSSFLTDRLAEPEMYARINLTSQKNLSKGRSLPLYEITASFRENGKFPGKTTVWSLEYFRALMGAESKTYDQFKRLKNKIIDPNVKKVNDETDILIEPVFHKTGRRYSGIQFLVKNKPQMELFPPTDYEQLPIFQRLVGHGVSVLQAEKFMADHPEDYLERKVSLLERKLAEGKVDSPSGYLVAAIKNDYDDSDPKAEKKALAEQKKAEAQKRAAEKLAEQKRAEDEQKAKEAAEAQELEDQANAILKQMAQEERDALEAEFGKEVANDGVIGKSYEKGGVENIFVKGFWYDFVIKNG